jgi:glycosyltransferase involved in cell wall biosynthesis
MQQNTDSKPPDEYSVSVIIRYSPAHTPAEMLEETKRSVKKQAVPTDIIVIEDTEQRGPAWARNQGIEKADSRFIAFVDADDKWKPDKLERQLNVMNIYKAGLCVEGSADDEDGKISTKSFIERLLFGDLLSLTSSILIDSSCVDTRFCEKLERREDHLFMTESAITAGVCLVSGPIVEINKHDEGLSAQNTPELIYESDLKMAEYLSENPETKIFAEELRPLSNYRLGRQKQLQGDLQSGIPLLMKSALLGLSERRPDLSIKPIGAIIQTPWLFIKRFVSFTMKFN